MKKEDYDFILEISNSYFPLVDIVNDFQILKSKGRLEDFNYEAIQDDLVKIAKLFKCYHHEATKDEKGICKKVTLELDYGTIISVRKLIKNKLCEQQEWAKEDKALGFDSLINREPYIKLYEKALEELK